MHGNIEKCNCQKQVLETARSVTKTKLHYKCFSRNAILSC